jgi:hypothetical protein
MRFGGPITQPVVVAARGSLFDQQRLIELLAMTAGAEPAQPDGLHVMQGGTSREAAQLVRGIIATRDNRARTAHDTAASPTVSSCPTG